MFSTIFSSVISCVLSACGGGFFWQDVRDGVSFVNSRELRDEVCVMSFIVVCVMSCLCFHFLFLRAFILCLCALLSVSLCI